MKRPRLPKRDGIHKPKRVRLPSNQAVMRGALIHTLRLVIADCGIPQEWLAGVLGPNKAHIVAMLYNQHTR
jgi:hypothetical protein